MSQDIVTFQRGTGQDWPKILCRSWESFEKRTIFQMLEFVSQALEHLRLQKPL